MKFNTSRAHRLAFGLDAEAYDKGRLCVPGDVVDKLVAELGLDCTGVIEVGAGTGQLTRPLLARGLLMWAIEPDARLAERLRSNCPSPSLRVVGADFEDVELPDLRTAPGRRGIVAANSFHWLQPRRALDRAADLLEGEEKLVLYWSYPMWRSDRQQLAFNDHVSPDLADLARDPVTHWADVERSAAEGRDEVLSHGAFVVRGWTFRVTEEDRNIDEMADLWASYGSSAGSRSSVLAAVEQTQATVGEEALGTKTLHYFVAYAREGRAGSPSNDADQAAADD